MTRRLWPLMAALISCNVVPAQACNPWTVMFFDANSAEVTESTKNTLAPLISQQRKYVVTYPPECRYSIRIIAHLDSAESSKPGTNLDTRRGEALKETAIALGWPRERFQISAVGAAKPLVPTGPNVSEPQNRRVEIRFFSDVEGPRSCEPVGATCSICYVTLPSGQKCPQ